MDEKKEKRVLNSELDDDVKKVSVTGLGNDNQVVMAQELDEDELDQATGGSFRPHRLVPLIPDEDDEPLPELDSCQSLVNYCSIYSA